ncbi:hypothetical protein FQN57_006810 [Myotisia sp. PD_48]|nr:hypothetical protein FQN57_006810 [Myotisia sp. PD_48]
MSDLERHDVVIVGAGWYGLIAATTYLTLAPETSLLILDDKETIGGVWLVWIVKVELNNSSAFTEESKESIYPNLFAQVGHGLFEYSFYPMKREGLTEDRYISGETIHDYLNSFARDYDLVRRTRLNTRVTNVEKLSDGSWLFNIKDNAPIIGTKLIWATGVSSGPYVPSFPQNNFESPIIHSSLIGPKMEELKGPSVNTAVVVGAAKSSYDTVFLLLKAGKKVHWIIREDGSGPLAIMPPRLFGLFNTVDVMATRALAAFSPAVLNTSGLAYRLIHRTSIGRLVTKAFWRTVTAAAEYHAGYQKNDNARKLRPKPEGYGVFWANSGLGLASVPGFWDTFHAGDCTVHRTEIASLTNGNVINLQNGISISTDYLILCTGWTENLGPFKEDLRREFNLPSKSDFGGKWDRLDKLADEKVSKLLPFLANPPDTTGKTSERRPWRLYRRLISPDMAAKGDRSVFFPGQIHSVFTPLVGELQALWGVAYLLDRLDVPDQDEMEEEIAVWNSWTKKRYLEQGRKHAYSIYDYLAYIDTLARDMGIKTKRKKNFLAEAFSSYRPDDYNGLIKEFLEAEQRRAKEKPAKQERTQTNNQEQVVRQLSKVEVRANGLSQTAASTGLRKLDNMNSVEGHNLLSQRVG